MKDKRQGKIDKHFPVYMDGHKCRILNYRVEDDHLTIITKIKNSNLGIRGDTGKIVIEKDGVKITYIVEHCTVFYGNTICYGYHILEEKRTNIDNENQMIEVIRAEKEWQRAGAYSVRIQGMNRQHHISLQEEFDEHDGDNTKYIVLLDSGYPVATCRFYELNAGCVMLGRVVVLPEYRGKELGRKVVEEAEKWVQELGYSSIKIESRIVAVGFYEKLGFRRIDETVIKSGVFDCVPMVKEI